MWWSVPTSSTRFVLFARVLKPSFVEYFVCTLLFALVPAGASAASWYPLGPFGGDARVIAADPADSQHLYLGTEIGWLYDSHDAGTTWKRVAQVAKQDDLVIDHILVDTKNPKRLIVGTYRVGASDGGIYISDDMGKTWYAQAEMKRQSVRAMARSDSDPQIIVAGTLQGIFQSNDNGVHWKQISPIESKEIHEVESLAIDPIDPRIIYAGTWHLPWKTVDGGENWTNIKQGIIDDSDVFSIIIDPQNTKTIYLSACSGIYKSSDAAEQFRKIQGIPSTARRTRKLLQDPSDSNTVYAGTTEGLYKTTDAGRTFTRLTEPDVIVNDVYVDPKTPSHVLLATDRGGVLSSEDGGTTFAESNTGFSARQVSSITSDRHNAGKIYVGVVNGKETGGVFASADGGLSWQQQSSGLHGRDVFSLTETPAGTLLAGTRHGIYRYEEDHWRESSDLAHDASPKPLSVTKPAVKQNPKKAVRPSRSSHDKAPAALHRHSAPIAYHANAHARLLRTVDSNRTGRKRRKPLAKKTALRKVSVKQEKHEQSSVSPRRPEVAAVVKVAALDAVVFALVTKGDTVYAGTDHGLLQSAADGHSWEKADGATLSDVHFLAMHDAIFFAANLKQLTVSTDGGATWGEAQLPTGLTQVTAVEVDDAGTLWLGGVEGIFYSTDRGATWQTLRQLFLRSVTSIHADFAEHRVYVTSSLSTYAFVVHVPDNKVTFTDTGWPLRFVRPAGDHLLAATLFEGTVVQPVMLDTPFQTVGK